MTALVALALHATAPDSKIATPLLEFKPAMKTSALAVAFAGATFTLIVRSGMGRRWRIDVPDEAPDDLVTQGVFDYSLVTPSS